MIFVKFLLIVLVFEWSGSKCSQSAVGLSDEKPADEIITQLLHKVKLDWIRFGMIPDSKKNASLTAIPISYKTQVVKEQVVKSRVDEVTIYYVKAKVGGSCAILRITNYEKVICLSQNGDDVSLDGINYIDSCDDEIESFDRFGKWDKITRLSEELSVLPINLILPDASIRIERSDVIPISLIMERNRDEPRDKKKSETIYFVKAKYYEADKVKCAILRIVITGFRSHVEYFDLDDIKKVNCSCQDEIKCFNSEEIKEVIGPFEEKSSDKEIEDVVLKVKSQIRKHGFYSNQTEGYPSFEPISYRKKVDNGGAAYFVKASHSVYAMSNELLCYLLRISIKLLDVGEKSEKAASLDHVKKLKSCQDEVEYFEPETKQMEEEQYSEVPYGVNDNDILDIISDVETQLIFHDIYHTDKKNVKPISYIREQTANGIIYFIKGFQVDEEGECFLLRIHLKIPRHNKIRNGDKFASLEGVKKMKSCTDGIEFFEPEAKRMDVDEKPAKEEIKGIVQQVDSQIRSIKELLTNEYLSLDQFELISYREKIVSIGNIYYVKAYRKDFGECTILRIFKKLPRMVKKGDKAVSLDGIQWINSCRDEIDFFEPESSKMKAELTQERVLGLSSNESDTDYIVKKSFKTVQFKTISYFHFFPEIRQYFSMQDLTLISYKMKNGQNKEKTFDLDGGSALTNSLFVKSFSRAEKICVVIRIDYFGDTIGSPDYEQSYKTHHLNGLKQMKSCRNEIRYFDPYKTTGKETDEDCVLVK